MIHGCPLVSKMFVKFSISQVDVQCLHITMALRGFAMSANKLIIMIALL